jgi:hypothetical protein
VPVTCPFEEVGVDIERNRRARVAEDAAYLHNVELQIEDEMAGEGMAEVVKAQRWPAVTIQLCAFYGPLQSPPTDVALRLRGTA